MQNLHFVDLTLTSYYVLTYDKSTVEVLQNFVTFSEYMNFNIIGNKNNAKEIGVWFNQLSIFF